MNIQGRALTKDDKGSKVTYVPPHANGNASHADSDGGLITSWNYLFVFVDYGTGHPQATTPSDLVWG